MTRLLSLALLLVLCTCNKLVIFSGIALCYSDSYILAHFVKYILHPCQTQQILCLSLAQTLNGIMMVSW